MHEWQAFHPLSHLLSSLVHILNNLQMIYRTEHNANTVQIVAKLYCLKNDKKSSLSTFRTAAVFPEYLQAAVG